MTRHMLLLAARHMCRRRRKHRRFLSFGPMHLQANPVIHQVRTIMFRTH
jgi:hypothetical protein